jgi:transmembrane sensor
MNRLHDIENINWDLLAKYLCNEAGESERQEIEAWAGQSGINLAELNNSRELIDKARLWFESRHYNSAEAWENIERRLQSDTPVIQMQPEINTGIFYRRVLQVAATILLAVSLGTAGYYIGFRQQKPAIFTEVVSNDRQVVAGITLPDGSVVTLNGNSVLTYPKAFTENTREVSITGEAFFEIQPDASRPFLITAGTAQIKVLGTSFNVCAYPEDETVEVVVESGKVQVTCSSLAQTSGCDLILAPGEKGSLSNMDFKLVKSVNSDLNLSAWRTRQLVFEETPLSEVIATLEKIYFVNIQLADPALSSLVLTANFNQQTVDFILDVIRLTFSLELTSENGQYFLISNKNNNL